MNEKENNNLRNFAAGLLYSLDAAEAITLEDAEYTISAWTADGVDVPDGFTAAYFVQLVNGGRS